MTASGPTIVSTTGGIWGTGWVEGLPFPPGKQWGITSPYGPRPLTPELIAAGATNPFHNGTDFQAAGNILGTPLYSVADGVIDFVMASMGWGNVIRVRHDDDSAAMYVHMQFPPPRNWNDRVKRGDCIGLVDSTGASSGSHLHFELFRPGYQTLYINEGDTLDAMSSQGQALWVFADSVTLGPTPQFHSTPPPAGRFAALVAAQTVTLEEMCANLAEFGCDVQALAVLDNVSSLWSTYIPGAPAAFNANAPAVLTVGAPFMVRAR